MTIQDNVPLSKYTSFHVGGPARYFIDAANDQDVLTGLELAQQEHLPFFILGKGSNTLFPDSGYPGVVIHMTDRTLSRDGTLITAASGVFMRQIVNFAHDAGLVGLEELAGIPGTVGGAVRGNAGTWQTEMKDVVTQVDVYQFNGTTKEWELVILSNEQCQFGYRHSRFKDDPNLVILRATVKVHPGDVQAGQALVMKDLQQRHAKQPYNAPSAGSVFKNPDAASGIYSGKLLEEAGLKETQIGGAQISPKHANFIVNQQKATSGDILALIDLMKQKVWEANHIKLEPEIVIVPKNPSVTIDWQT